MPYILLIVYFAFTAPAYAYVDPNTGGLLAQLLTPLILMAAVMWGIFRRKLATLKRALLNIFRRNDANEKGD